MMFEIEDKWHSETVGKHSIFEAALAHIRELAKLPWDESPNLAPCGSWETCGRAYAVVEYEHTTNSWTVLQYVPIAEIDAKGVRWEEGFAPDAE